jgi:hypothetical protein
VVHGAGRAGTLETTPLVSNGVLYATGPWSTVFAMDARTGAMKWTWDPKLPTTGGPSPVLRRVNRGVALSDGLVFVGLLDGRLVALDADKGTPVWDVQTSVDLKESYSITGAPRVVKGQVIIGNGGAENAVRGYISAYDAMTGRLAWRFFTVPGDPSKPFEHPELAMARRPGPASGGSTAAAVLPGTRWPTTPRPTCSTSAPATAAPGTGTSAARRAATTCSGVDPRDQSPTPAVWRGTSSRCPAISGTTPPRSRSRSPTCASEAARARSAAGAEERLLLRHRSDHRRVHLG